MRSLILLLTLFVAPPLSAADPREAEIHDFMEAFGRCWDAHAKDPNCMDKLLTPDFNAVMLRGPVERAEFIRVVQGLPDSNTWGSPGKRTPNAVVHFYGPVAVVTWGVHVMAPMEQIEQITHVIVNVDGKGLRLARYHNSRLPVANPAQK
jgi:hypothetical protein